MTSIQTLLPHQAFPPHTSSSFTSPGLRTSACSSMDPPLSSFNTSSYQVLDEQTDQQTISYFNLSFQGLDHVLEKQLFLENLSLKSNFSPPSSTNLSQVHKQTVQDEKQTNKQFHILIYLSRAETLSLKATFLLLLQRISLRFINKPCRMKQTNKQFHILIHLSRAETMSLKATLLLPPQRISPRFINKHNKT